MIFDPLELGKADRRGDIGHPVIVADNREPVTAIGVHALSPEEAKTLRQLGAVGNDGAPLPRGDDLVPVEAEGAAVTERADPGALPGRTMRFGRILDDP